MYSPRTLEPAVLTATEQFPGLLVTGARPVGKTTFLQHLSQSGRTYATLDDPIIRNLAREDTPLFLSATIPGSRAYR